MTTQIKPFKKYFHVVQFIVPLKAVLGVFLEFANIAKTILGIPSCITLKMFRIFDAALVRARLFFLVNCLIPLIE